MPKRRSARKRSMRRYNPFRGRYHRFRRGKAPLPLLPITGGVVVPFVRSFSQVGGMQRLQDDPQGFTKGMIDQIGQRYIGISLFPEESGVTGFRLQNVVETYGGLILGVLGHKLASTMGINRYMKKIPFVGKYIAL